MMHPGNTLAGVDGGLGEVGGNETHTLTEGEIPSHTHSVNDPSQAFSQDYSSGSDAYGVNIATGLASGPAGGGLPHNNVQPFICVNVAIKL